MSPFILSDQALTVFHQGTTHSYTSEHHQWEAMLEALRQGDFDALITLGDTAASVSRYLDATGQQDIELLNGHVYYNGTALNNILTARILEMQAQGFPIQPMIEFMRRLMQNPSYRSREQLYAFLEANQVPITEDGCFLTYKLVDEDYRDCHTHTISNAIGETPTMERWGVDDDPNRTCSSGFHVCGLSYLRSFSGRHLMACKVDPADVVSVPTDYNNAKMRVCRYTVIDELPMSLIADNTPAWTTAVYEDEDEDEDELWEEDEDESQNEDEDETVSAHGFWGGDDDA